MQVTLGRGKPIDVDLAPLEHLYIQPSMPGPGSRQAFTYMVANAESAFFGVSARVEVDGRAREVSVVLSENDVREIIRRTVGGMSPHELQAWLRT